MQRIQAEGRPNFRLDPCRLAEYAVDGISTRSRLRGCACDETLRHGGCRRVKHLDPQSRDRFLGDRRTRSGQ